MAANLAKKGHDVRAFDLSKDALDRAVAAGCIAASSASEAVSEAEYVVTMLPAGQHVRAVYENEIFGKVPAAALLMDCSTIDVASAKAVGAAAASKGIAWVDAPVSGGIAAANGGTLTFMAGGSAEHFARAEPILSLMGKAVIHAGGVGAGQAAKIRQQHAARRDDGCDLRGVRARAEARPRSADLLRYLVEGERPELVDDQLLPVARRRPGKPRPIATMKAVSRPR